MKSEIKKIWIDPDIASQFAEWIEDTEMEPMGRNEYVGEFEVEIENTTIMCGHKFPILVTCSGKLVQSGKFYSHWYDCPPEFDLKGQYINNIDFHCFIDGQEVEFNCNEIQKKIEKIITK